MNLPHNPDSAHPWLAEDLLASLPEAVAVVRNSHVLYVNAAFTRIFGFEAAELRGANLREFIVPENHQQEIAQVEKAVDQVGFFQLDTVRKNKAGARLDVALQASPLIVQGDRIATILSFRDIGNQKRVEAKLQFDALHDPLTRLPNRALFLDRLNQAFSQRSRRHGRNCGVLFLDLDRFKEINDSLGHAAGDELLVAVAERLRGALRPQDTAARLGGDEFAILVENILSVSDMEHVAERVLQSMAREFKLGGHSTPASASIGVAIAGPDHTAPELLIRDADYAMYRAKQDGGGRFEIFDKQFKAAAASLQEREQELRDVLDNRQFEVWYQPICGLLPEQPRRVKLEGFEAMLCWRRADGTVASFGELLQVAEETGLSISLGREKLKAVCGQLRGWTDALPHTGLTLSINLSQRQFYHPDLVAQLKKTLAASGADPAQLLFEVGEDVLSENPDAALVIFERLLACNVRLAVDDFGSGLGALNHLVRLPIDVLKLDPKLTQAAVHSSQQAAVLESLIQLGGKLGVQVVAQGIETSEQLEALVGMGCKLGQGPLLSVALEPTEAQKLTELGSWTLAERDQTENE